MWERFSYFGMLSLLFLYMEKSMGFSTARMGVVFGAYTGCVYLSPLLGGHLADRFLGAGKAVVLGASVMAAGHFLMAANTRATFFAALALIILGTGFFKPSISAMVGSLYQDDGRRDAGFNLFYMSINIGAFFAPLVCGYLGSHYGWHYGFFAAGFGLSAGLLAFLALRSRLLPGVGGRPQRVARENPEPLPAGVRSGLSALAVLFPFSVLFFAAYSQAGSSLMLFADRSVDRTVLGLDIPPMFLQSLNPVMVLLLAPALTWFWGRAAARGSVPVFSKFGAGLAFASAQFFILWFLVTFTSGLVGLAWLLPVFAMQTLGELCVAPVGLSAVTRMAPPGRTSLALAVWFLSIFAANLLGGLYAGTYDRMPRGSFFLIPAIALFLAAWALAGKTRLSVFLGRGMGGEGVPAPAVSGTAKADL